jgi:hypothetical protein
MIFFSSASLLSQLFDAAIVYYLPALCAVLSQPTSEEDGTKGIAGFVTHFPVTRNNFFSIFLLKTVCLHKERTPCEILVRLLQYCESGDKINGVVELDHSGRTLYCRELLTGGKRG